jgi:hypothetical protein
MAVKLTPNARYDRSTTGLVPPLTWLSWVRPDALPVDYAALFYAGSASNNDHVAVFIHPTSVISVWDDSFTLRAETDVVTVGQWLFLAVVVDAAGNLTLYWRRETQTSLSSDTGTVNLPISDAFLYVGTNREAPAFAHSFNGAFAHTRAFGRVLPAGVVMDESTSPVALEPVGASGGDWPFTTTAGTDVSGQDNDLFLDVGTGSVAVTDGPDIDPHPAPLPSQFPRIGRRLEFAWGADLSTDPRSWPWSDATADLEEAQTIQVKAGRSDESSQAQPSSTGFTLNNPNGDYTPGHPLGAHYPHVRQEDGTPCRIGFHAGAPHLAIDGTAGARARTPDHTDLDITGNMWGKIDLTVLFWPLHPGTTAKITGKFASGNRSWQLALINDQVRFFWSTDGAATGELSATTTVPLWAPASNRLVIVWQFIANNGAGGRTTRFWLARRWTDTPRLHEEIVQAGTSSIFSGTAPLDIGDIVGSGFSRPIIEVHRLQLRSGDETGTLVASPDFTRQQPGATSLVDSTGKTWSLEGTAAITNLQWRLAGQVDEIAPTWPWGDLFDPDNPDQTPGEARTTFAVSGVTRRMTQNPKALQSAIYRLVMSRQNLSRVMAYLPFEDGSDAEQISTPIPDANPGYFGGELQFASDDTLPGSKPLLTVSGGQIAGWGASFPLRAGITNWAVDFFTRIPTREPEPASTVIGFVDTTGTVRAWRLALSSTNLRIRGTDAEGAAIVDTLVSASGWTSNWTQVRLRLELGGGGTVNWEVNFLELGAPVVFGLSGSYSGFAGRPTAWRHLDTAPPDGWSFGHLVVTTDIPETSWLTPADVGWRGETAGRRFARLCDEERVPYSIWGDRDDTEAMGPQNPDTLPSLLTECAQADMGLLGEQRTNLALHYRTRATLYSQPPQVALDAGVSEIANAFEPVDDDQRRRNDVIVTRRDGASHRVVDPDVETGVKPRYDSEDTLNLATDDQALAQAGWRFHLGTWPGMRYPALTIPLDLAPARIDDRLALVPGDRQTVDNLPPQHPPGPVDVLAEEVLDDITPERWIAGGACSAGGPWQVGILEDPTSGRADTSGSELDALVDADDTTWTVDVTEGPLWTTTAADFPFDVTAGGEVVTVTAISGASSPQTFTVIRAVNGIQKSHPAGTQVALATPMRTAL